MSHNIIVESGKSVRLTTAGKYCDRDIIISANSEDLDGVLSEQDALLEELVNALDEIDAADNTPVIEPLDIKANGTYVAHDGVDGYSPIVVDVPIPDGYIEPNGTLEIKENGTHDAKIYETVLVDVPIPDGYIIPSGTKEIIENGEYDIAEYASVNVNVPTGGGDDMVGSLADRTITKFSSNSCTAIGDYSFRGCKSLTALVAPNATRVGEYALYQCNNLRSITLPSVTTVATNSFRDAQYLEVVDLPKVTAIASNTFYGCRGLKTLILRSETLVTLNATSAFTNCYRILGTQNAGFNPNGEKIGFIYVPKALLSDDDETKDYRRATNWSSDNLVTQFRAIEDYPEICGGEA